MNSERTQTIVLVLDAADYDTIQAEITHRQVRSRALGASETILPDGDSNLAGAIVAECVRDLNDYRQRWEAEHGSRG